jgi:regulator of sirC expression with transglutaminase-like and TPR domain
MRPILPLCCSQPAFELLKRQVDCIESPDALVQGAVAIAMHELESVDPAAVDAQLQGYADAVRRRVHGTQPQALLAHLHQVLFEEEGFIGNAEDYYAAANSYLPTVLDTKRGLPITLSLIYKIVAERLGLRVGGVGLPGHFIVSVETDTAPMLVDTFAGGRILTSFEAHERLREMFGQEIEWSEEYLQTVTNRQWLTRMLQNLLNTFGGAGRYTDVAAVLEMEMLLWPKQDHLQRDLALVLARIGMSEPASMWLNSYLQHNPDDPQRQDLEQLLEALGT